MVHQILCRRRTQLARFMSKTDKPDLRGVAFYLFTPLALAAFSATNSAYSRDLGLGLALCYVGLLSLIPWWIGEGTSRAVWFTARHLRPPLWMICVLGALTAGIFVGPYTWIITELFTTLAPSNSTASVAATNAGWQETLLPMARAIVIWTAANYAFDRLLGFPRFRYPGRGHDKPTVLADSPSSADCGILQKLTRIHSLSEILFIKAEEHYVMVHSEHESELITYRFGAALDDLKGEDGFQVHRSYWIRRSGVDGKNDEGSQLTIRATNGATIPVSRPYHALVRQVL